MSRGGDRRPIDRSHGRDLSYAYLLLNAMCENASEAGRRFNREREAIFVRWERLLRVLSNHNGDKLGNVAGVPFEVAIRFYLPAGSLILVGRKGSKE